MHDDHTVAFTIRRPCPQVRHQSRRFSGQRRWRPGSPFIYLLGREIYFPPLVTVWHVEPGNGDSRPHPCGDPKWRRHIHHWELQLHPLQHLRRRLLTRCEWCSGRSTKSDPVNCSHQWDREPGQWWRGERGLYHHLCSAAHHAHQLCFCEWPVLDHDGYGNCARCGRTRSWMRPEVAANYPTPTQRYLASLDSGERPDRARVDALRERRAPNV